MVGSNVRGVCWHNFVVDSRDKLLSSLPQSETIDSGVRGAEDVIEWIEASSL